MLQGAAADCNSAEATHAWFDSKIAHQIKSMTYGRFSKISQPPGQKCCTFSCTDGFRHFPGFPGGSGAFAGNANQDTRQDMPTRSTCPPALAAAEAARNRCQGQSSFSSGATDEGMASMCGWRFPPTVPFAAPPACPAAQMLTNPRRVCGFPTSG